MNAYIVGAGMRAARYIAVYITDSTFDGNYIPNPRGVANPLMSGGGAIFLDKISAVAAVDRCTFRRNYVVG